MPAERTAPLFRAKIRGLQISISRPNLDKQGVIQHMEALGGPFPPGQDFSLLVPLDLRIEAASIECTLRDYPVPLWRVPGIQLPGRSNPSKESVFICETRMVIGEELAGDDSYFLVPCKILPSNLGQKGAAELELRVAKTLNPVKTYAEPKITVKSQAATDFTWGQSYAPAMQDLARVLDTFTRAPLDPSPKLGFWDKIRLILHWKIIVNFDGAVHLHLKGE
jgi:hypothetical protein